MFSDLLGLCRGWAVIWGAKCLWRRLFTLAATTLHPPHPPGSPFAATGIFARLGLFFLAVCCRMQKCQIWGEFPSLTPFQPCGGGGEGRGHLTISFGRRVASPGAQASVSLESACLRAPPCFPTLSEPEIQATVSQQNKELRERPRTREAAPVGVLGYRISRDRDAPGEHRHSSAADSRCLRRARAGAAAPWLRWKPPRSGLCAPF